jgi:tRNA pseudouridine32 synthase/23S rRNA pseudouridine746 synthase
VTSPILKPEIIFQDPFLLVVNKPAGLLSVPGKNPDLDNLIDLLKHDFSTARIVHRLDMATSGLMVIGLDAESHRKLGRQFETRHVSKTYQAIVHGLIESDEGIIDLPLICDWPNRPRQKVDYEVGKSAQTRYQVLHRDHEKNHTKVALFPITGRSHQLRVHLAEIGHSILGCEFYAEESIRVAAPRLLLHACELSFSHPETNERMTYYSAAPF